MRNKLLYICTLAILSAGVFYVGWNIHQPAPGSTGTVVYGPDLSSPEPYLPFAYEQCPNVDTSDDYVCIYKLSHSTLAEADALAQKLIQTSPKNTKEQMAGYYDALHSGVQLAQKARDAYFDGICDLDEMLVYGGSGMDLEREACRYYYAQQYLGLLKSLEKNVTQSLPRVSAGIQEALKSEPDITFLSQEGLKSLAYVYSVPLPNGKTFYLGIPVKIPADEHDNAGMHCGTGGCLYNAYFGNTYVSDKPTRLTPITGFDSYSIDCDTGKAIFYSDGGENFLGSLHVDKANKVVRVYYSLNAALGSENIYHIADDGTPKLIASYSNECNDSMKQATSTNTLYRDTSYPSYMTEM